MNFARIISLICWASLGASQQATSTGYKFSQITWFWQKIIGADFDANDAFYFIGTRGVNQYWNFRLLA